jgi:hypothetical protein
MKGKEIVIRKEKGPFGKRYAILEDVKGEEDDK